MSTDDDLIRRALTAASPSVTAHTALRDLGPSMRRVRLRHRIAVSAAVAALLVGGGAGVLALTAARDQTTRRSVTSDQTGQPLPTVTEVVEPSTIVSTKVAGVDEPPPVTGPPAAAPPATAPPEDVGGAPTDSGETPAPAAEMPPLDVDLPEVPIPVEPPAPVDPPAPVAAPPTSFQTITSTCGDVVVSINRATLQIVMITARPGFDQKVSDDGPTSIEMTFSGEGDVKCELHAELESGELRVEVQGSETEQ